MTTAPAWLEAHLQAIGVADSHGLAGTFRTARTRPCTTCGTQVIAGLDAEVGAFPATVEPTPLNETGEILALLAGRTTYSLDAKGRLWVRQAHNIPAPWRGIVLPEHKCGQPPLAARKTDPEIAIAKEPPF